MIDLGSNADVWCADVSVVKSADTDTSVYTAALPNQYCGRAGRTSMLISMRQYIMLQCMD